MSDFRSHGGSPQEQLRLACYSCLNVVSADGNMIGQQARKGRTWSRKPLRKGHWAQLKDLGDDRPAPAMECFRRSLGEIKRTWEARGRN